MSVAWPPAWPQGWWSRIRACGQGQALARRAGRQQHGGGRGGLPEADRGDVGLDVLHRVVDGEQRGDVATGGVDVDVDVLVGVLGLEVQQLGADQVGDRVVDRRAQEDDVLLEQPASRGRRPARPGSSARRPWGPGSCGLGSITRRRSVVCVGVGRRASSVVGVGSSRRRLSSAVVGGRRRRARGRPGRSGWPSSSTISTCSSEPLERLALPEVRAYRRRAARCARTACATLLRLLPDAARRPRSISASRSSSVTSMPSASATARRARSTLHRLARRPRAARRRAPPGSCRWRRGTARASMPWACRRMREVLRGGAASRCATSGSGASSSTSSASASAVFSRSAIWACSLAARWRCARRGRPRSSSTVSNSDASLAHSSSTSGSTCSLHLLDQDPELELALLVGVGVRRRRTRGCRRPWRPASCSSSSGAIDAGADLVEVVVGREAGDAARRRASRRCRWRRASPACGGRSTSASSAELLAQAVDLGVDLLVGGARDGRSRPAGRRSPAPATSGPDLDDGVEGDRRRPPGRR